MTRVRRNLTIDAALLVLVIASCVAGNLSPYADVIVIGAYANGFSTGLEVSR